VRWPGWPSRPLLRRRRGFGLPKLLQGPPPFRVRGQGSPRQSGVAEDFAKAQGLKVQKGLNNGDDSSTAKELIDKKRYGPRRTKQLEQVTGLQSLTPVDPKTRLPKAPKAPGIPATQTTPKAATRRRAVVAEPGYIWSKHPATTGEEFSKRVAKGDDPDKVFREIIAEIEAHYQSGEITGRDAKRSANEAFGRLLRSARRRRALNDDGVFTPEVPHPPVTSGVDGEAHGGSWSTNQGHSGPVPGMGPGSMGGKVSRRKQAGPGSRPYVPETDEDDFDEWGHDLGYQRCNRCGERGMKGGHCQSCGGHSKWKNSSRKQAWSGWGPAQKKQHRAEGWDWDNHLNGYVSSKSPRQFQCSCGNAMAVPGYTNCKCGKIWNSYVIGTGGDRHEAAAEKFICREIPVRKDVIVAKKRTARPKPVPITEHDVDRWRHPDKCTICGKPATGEHVTKDGGIICPEHNLHVQARRRKALTLDLPGGESFEKEQPSRKKWADEDDGGDAWPSDHHPKTPTMGSGAKDLYRAPGGKFAPGNPGAFKPKKK
jgi:hypothetical protein